MVVAEPNSVKRHDACQGRAGTRLRYHPRDATSWTGRRMTRLLGRALLRDAHEHRFAVPAFNVSNLETIQGVLAAAESAAAPVILQISPGAIAYAGYEPLTRLVMDLAGTAAVPVIVHLDHCREPAIVERAIDDGFDSVMFDGSRLAFDENVEATCRLVALARARDPGIAFEAELGVIGGREDTTPEAALAARTTPDEAARFVAATDIDVLAPNLGNLHRMPDDSTELDLAQIAAIAAATDRPIALHGGSGIDQAQLRAAIDAGIGKVNIVARDPGTRGRHPLDVGRGPRPAGPAPVPRGRP